MEKFFTMAQGPAHVLTDFPARPTGRIIRGIPLSNVLPLGGHSALMPDADEPLASDHDDDGRDGAR